MSKMCTVRIPLPESCSECWLRGYDMFGDMYCIIQGRELEGGRFIRIPDNLSDDGLLESRPDFCPLIVEAQDE